MVKIDVRYNKLFINNQWKHAESRKTFPTINPQNETVIAEIAEANEVDIDKAVEAAKKAFSRNSPWRAMDASQRGALLLRLAELMELQARYLAELETIDSGKPVKAAEEDVYYSISVIRYYAGKADKILGNTIPADGEVLSFTIKEPVGVCAQILSWTYPIRMMVRKIAPALAAGCTIVVKPAEQTPLTALAVAALIKESGFPPGVVNVVPGYGPAVSALTQHPDVNKVTFTGSTEVGRTVISVASSVNIKRVTLELSGKSPLVVFNDADVEKAAQMAHAAAFVNAGQSSFAASRTYVQSDIYDQFVKASSEIAKKRSVGYPFDDIQQGPQTDKATYHKVLEYIAFGKEAGARCVAGGEKFGDEGYYIQPTVFADVTDDMKIAKEEILGPVQCISKFETYEEVVDRANKSEYGHGAGVITNDITTALNFIKEVQAGSIWINTYDHITTQTPFGGFKNSGLGREMGEDGIEQYLEAKTITLALPKLNLLVS